MPYMLVVGEREAQANTVSVRKRNGKSLGEMSVTEVVNLIRHDDPHMVTEGSLHLE
ncbi:MAG: His/Gly/Thr/Pro-type tRNA ligase C-terminal domain-containing protein [Planctomycetota bacterium]